MTYDIIKKNYDHKLWSIKMIQNAVKKGIINKEQFMQITGMAYVDEGLEA